jgi:hypothetical protein
MEDGIPEIVHPVRHNALTPLERHLWRMRMVVLEVQVMLRGYYSAGDVAATVPDGLLFSLTNHGLILISKFLEVWDDLGSAAKSVPKAVDVRRAVSPLVDRILVWRGISRFRNTALAHAYETKDGRLVGPWHLMHTHQVPTYHAEVLLLLHCVMTATAGVLAAFLEEYKALSPTFQSSTPTPDEGRGIRLGTAIAPALRGLAAEVDRRLTTMGVSPSNPVYAEFREELIPTPML